MRLSVAVGLSACAAGSTHPSEPLLPVTVMPTGRTLESGGLRLVEDQWTHGEDQGLAWRVSVPLPGHATVSAVDSVADFAALLPADAGPWAAINGGFYDTSREAMGLVVSGGTERAPLRPTGGSGVFFVGPTGPRVVHRDQWQPGPTEALQSVDRLIDRELSVVTRMDGPKAARSAVVVGETRLWLVALAATSSVTATPDGYQLHDTIGRGLSLGSFAEYLIQQTAAVEALNLDGAVSTQLSLKTADGSFAVRGERGTINAVVLRP